MHGGWWPEVLDPYQALGFFNHSCANTLSDAPSRAIPWYCHHFSHLSLANVDLVFLLQTCTLWAWFLYQSLSDSLSSELLSILYCLLWHFLCSETIMQAIFLLLKRSLRSTCVFLRSMDQKMHSSGGRTTQSFEIWLVWQDSIWQFLRRQHLLKDFLAVLVWWNQTWGKNSLTKQQ